MSEAWERTLAECEARLDAAGAHAPGAVEFPPFSAPAGLDPMPAALAGRARALVDRGEKLAHELGGEQDRIRSELRRLPRMPAVPGQGHFDTKA